MAMELKSTAWVVIRASLTAEECGVKACDADTANTRVVNVGH